MASALYLAITRPHRDGALSSFGHPGSRLADVVEQFSRGPLK